MKNQQNQEKFHENFKYLFGITSNFTKKETLKENEEDELLVYFPMLSVKFFNLLTFYDRDYLRWSFLIFSSTKKCLEYCIFNKIKFNEIRSAKIKDFLNLLRNLKENKKYEVDSVLIDKPITGGKCLIINLENLKNENIYSSRDDG